jgi:hypothetical protein
MAAGWVIIDNYLLLNMLHDSSGGDEAGSKIRKAQIVDPDAAGAGGSVYELAASYIYAYVGHSS